MKGNYKTLALWKIQKKKSDICFQDTYNLILEKKKWIPL